MIVIFLYFIDIFVLVARVVMSNETLSVVEDLASVTVCLTLTGPAGGLEIERSITLELLMGGTAISKFQFIVQGLVLLTT